MSKVIYDFLTESPFFVESFLETFFANMSDEELYKELATYRNYVLRQVPLLYKEISEENGKITTTMEGFNSYRPTEDFLKQCSLYMDAVLVNDPLFEAASCKSDAGEVINKYLGFGGEGIDRKRLVDSIRYMIRLTPGVAAGFIKFVPLSYMHEPPQEIPIFASENYFSDILPKPLLEWFQKRTVVKSLTKTCDGWRVENDLHPARGIIVDFINHSGKGNIYQLFEQTVTKVNEQTKKVEFRLELPEVPPEKSYFDAWVFQSINRAAKNTYDQIVSEAYNASLIGSSYLTSSLFSADLLNLVVGNNDKIRPEIGNLILRLELPVISSISFDNLMYIRQNEGVAFSNFRIELEKQLRDLRAVTEPDKIKLKLDNVAHEMQEVQINEIRKKIEKLKRGALGDILIVAASLGASCFGVSTLLSGFGVSWGTNQLRTRYSEYVAEVKEAPAYFLWKVKDAGR